MLFLYIIVHKVVDFIPFGMIRVSYIHVVYPIIKQNHVAKSRRWVGKNGIFNALHGMISYIKLYITHAFTACKYYAHPNDTN